MTRTSSTKVMTGSSNMDITKLAYEKINERYSKATYLGLECVMDTQTGYINATKFCTAATDGKKMLKRYLRSDRYKDLIATYTEEESSEQICTELAIQVNSLVCTGNRLDDNDTHKVSFLT